MKHEVRKQKNSSVEIEIFLTNEEVSADRAAIVDEIAKKVEVKGFRKGKAPASIVAQEYKENVTGQLVEKMLDKHYDNVLKESNIEPISYISNLTVDTKDDNFNIKFTVDVYPEFEVANYKGLEEEKEEFVMSDEALQKDIDAMLARKADIKDAEPGYKAQLGDTVDLAFEGFMDGVAFEGGKSDSHMLKLGSHSFIDTFEDQLVGYTAGQEGEVNVKFPEDYGQESLAGKPAVFKVKINAIKKTELPTLDDEFAKEAGYESLADLKEKRYKEVETREQNRVDNDYRNKLMNKLVQDTAVELPLSMISGEIRNRIYDMEQQLSMQGLNLDIYLNMTHMTKEQLQQQIAPMAAMKVKSDLILVKIAKNENLKPTDDEIKERMTEVGKYYGKTYDEMEKELKDNGNFDGFKASIEAEETMKKALDYVVAQSKPKKAAN